MRRLNTLSLLPLLLAASVCGAEPIVPAAHGIGTTSTALSTSGLPGFDARNAASHLPTIYMPYTPGQRIPDGWKLVTVRVPVKEVRTRKITEEQIVQVPREVPCMLPKTIRFPTEVYKTYIRFKEIKVEDGTLQRHEDAPEADLDDLELDEDEVETTPVSITTANNSDGELRTVAAAGPPQRGFDAELSLPPSRPARPGYEWVPVTRIRQKLVTMRVAVQRVVEVDEGCWQEITVQVPDPSCKSNHCPPAGNLVPPGSGNDSLSGGPLPPGTMPVIRRVWQPNIVQREVTVMEDRQVTVDETYTDYVEQPAAAPDIAPDIVPDIGPDIAPDIAPEVMVTTDRTVRIPQYVTKAERHYLTKTIQVPGFKTVFDPVKKTVCREVPYEVVRMCEKQILVPADPRVIPHALLADPLAQPPRAAPEELLPTPTL